MKTIIFRILAFIVDMFVVNLFLVLISYIPFMRPDAVNIADEYKIISEVNTEYNKLSKRLDEMLYDNYIDLSEMNEINSSFPYFKDAFNEVPVNTEIDTSLKNKTIEKVNDIYLNKYYSYTYDVNKANKFVNIFGALFSVIYFGFIEYLFNGRTLGKRIFRLRTVDNDKIKKTIPWWKHIIRALFVSEAVFYLINVLLVTITHSGFDGILNAGWYAKANGHIYNFQYIYNVILLLVLLVRKDGRSIHDLILNTRIALFDKNNKEIKSGPVNEEDNN